MTDRKKPYMPKGKIGDQFNESTPLWTAEEMSTWSKSWDNYTAPPPEAFKYVVERQKVRA